MRKNAFFFLLLTLIFLQSNWAQEYAYKYFSSFDGIQIAFTDEGSGEPIILLHGFINTGRSWNKSALKTVLLSEGYRVLVPDLRGNGKSDQPESPEAYQNDAEVKDIIALANHLKLDTYLSVGYSRGSILLAKLLTLEPRLTKAVIGGMGVDFTNPNWDRRLAFADAFNGRAELTDETRGAVAYAKSIDANLTILGLLQDYQPVTLPEELKQISIPIGIVCGDKDLDNGDPKQWQQLLPHCELKLVQGDHNNTYKQVNFADAVLEFLEKN